MLSVPKSYVGDDFDSFEQPFYLCLCYSAYPCILSPGIENVPENMSSVFAAVAADIIPSHHMVKLQSKQHINQ